MLLFVSEKYVTVPRTEGISTTDVVGRMLLLTHAHHERRIPRSDSATRFLCDGDRRAHADLLTVAEHREIVASLFATGSCPRMSGFFRSFSETLRPPTAEDKIVYLAGAWDMFHAGHISTLERAKRFVFAWRSIYLDNSFITFLCSLGTYVIVGVHGDETVNAQRGLNLPILNLYERVLSVLGCRYVDNVLLNAPFVITEEMIRELNISVVVHGSIEVICSAFVDACK